MALTNAERQKAWRDKRNVLAKQAEASSSLLRNGKAGHKAAPGQLIELWEAAGDKAQKDFAGWFLFKHSELLKKASELAKERAKKLGATFAKKLDAGRVEEWAEKLADIVENDTGGFDPADIKESGGVSAAVERVLETAGYYNYDDDPPAAWQTDEDTTALGDCLFSVAREMWDSKEAKDMALAGCLTEYQLKHAVIDKIGDRITKRAAEIIRERMG